MSGGPGRPGGPGAQLDRRSSWAGVTRGDAVEVSGTPRGTVWEFVAHVTNMRTGEQWVEVVGGARGDRTIRSFAPDRVYPPDAKRSGRPSLADAPQLPLT